MKAKTPPPDRRAARDMAIWDRIPQPWREAFSQYPTCFRSTDYLNAIEMAGGDISMVQDVLRQMDPWVPQED